MASKMLSLALFVALVVVYCVTDSRAVRMVIGPTFRPFPSNYHDAAEINCFAVDDASTDFSMLELSKNGGQLVAATDSCTKTGYGNDTNGRYWVWSRIGNPQYESSLSLRIDSHRDDDFGVYTCTHYHVNYGVMTKDTTTRDHRNPARGDQLPTTTETHVVQTTEESVVARDQDADGKNDVIQVTEEANGNNQTHDENSFPLKSKLRKMESQIARLQKSDSDHKKDFYQINEWAKSMNRELQKLAVKIDLATKEAEVQIHGPPTVAFSASLHDRLNPTTGQTLEFRNVKLNEGLGYNPGTSEFTAPLAGTYEFHLSLRTETRDAIIYTRLKKNGVDFASLSVGDRDDINQSEITSYINLDIGDKVMAVVRGIKGSGAQLSPWDYTTFSGHRIGGN